MRKKILHGDEKGGTAIETRYTITLAIPGNLYEELMKIVPEDRLEKVIMDGIAHAIKMEKCCSTLDNQI